MELGRMIITITANDFTIKSQWGSVKCKFIFHKYPAPSLMSSESLNFTLGILIPGLGLAAILYGITCAQVFCYFNMNANNDHVLVKGLTVFLWLLNSMDIASIIHISYFYLISANTDIQLELKVVWSQPVHSFMVGCATFFVNSYYVWRLWSLSRNIFICVILVFMSTTTLALALVITVRATTTGAAISQFYGHLNLPQWLIVAASSSTFTTDFFAALSLTWCLLKSRTGLKESNSIIKILIAYTINTSLLAALSAFLALIATVALPPSNLPLFFSSLALPLQINGYLGSLNGRQFFRRWGRAHAQSKLETIGMSSLRITVPHDSSGSSRLETLEDQHLDLNLSIHLAETKMPKYTADVGIAI